MEIKTEDDYEKGFKKIDALILENFENSESKKRKFLQIARAIQSYEKEHYPLNISN